MKDCLTEQLPYYPSVFAVENEYQIYLLFSCEAMVKLIVGDQVICDDMCGLMRSSSRVHRICVPMALLDEAKAYTVVYETVIERKAYFPSFEAPVRLHFEFRPISADGELKVYHIADAHSMVDEPVAAAQYFGTTPDLLVLNGDIPNHAGAREHLDAVLKVASGAGRGECPIICTRGNHDTRGCFAEEFLNYIPHDAGRTYYTVRLGSVWALVLDCGEDKDDDCAEYGGTACFHPFRLAQSQFIRSVIANAEKEYAAPEVKHRLIISHVPFTYRAQGEFAIEEEIYRDWSRLIRDNVKPELMLCGHVLATEVWEKGCDRDNYGQACPVVIGSDPLIDPGKEEKTFVGCAITIAGNSATVVFNDSDGVIRQKLQVKLN